MWSGDGVDLYDVWHFTLDSCSHYPVWHLTRQAFSTFQVRKQGQEYQHDFCMVSELPDDREKMLRDACLPDSKAEASNCLDGFCFHLSKEARTVKYLLAE